jgi:DNA-binding winged helix-turn-helix (wHTH) protein
LIYTFNNFLLDTVKFTLTKVNESIPIEPQVFNIILYLIEKKDRVVSRQELLDTIWKGKIVSDSSISNHIKSARKILDDDGTKQAVIKTIHGRGYQFIASFEGVTNESETTEKTHKPKNFRLSIILFSVLILLIFFAIKYYQKFELNQSIQKIANYQEISYATFVAQAKRRNELVAMIEARIGEKREMQYEKYFSYYFKKLNGQEKFVFDQIRAMTDLGLYQNNLKIIEELNNHPEIYNQINGTKELQQHLVFWMNKYHSVFKKRQDMCLLYVGVEDGVPYPSQVNKNISDWLQNKPNNNTEKIQ